MGKASCLALLGQAQGQGAQEREELRGKAEQLRGQVPGREARKG